MQLNKIYNESAVVTMERMKAGFIDLTVTSPPYDKLRDYKGYHFPFKKIADQLWRVTAAGGVLVWVVGDQVIDGSESMTSMKQAMYFRKCGFTLHDTMIYKKNGSLPDNYRYFQSWEYMFVFSKGRPKTINFISDRKNRFKTKWGDGRTVRNKDGSLSARKNYEIQEFGRRNNVWEYATGFGYSSKDEIAFEHPAIFPEQLAADHIYSWSNEGDVVYDPMGGSGTVAKMAHLQKRNWIMSELSPEYCALAEKRLEKYLTQIRMSL